MTMAEPYLSQLQALITECGLDQAVGGDLVCRHFFSGAAAYYNGAIFMSLSPVGLAIKLPARDRTVLMDAGGRPLRYFPKAPVKKEPKKRLPDGAGRPGKEGKLRRVEKFRRF